MLSYHQERTITPELAFHQGVVQKSPDVHIVGKGHKNQEDMLHAPTVWNK